MKGNVENRRQSDTAQHQTDEQEEAGRDRDELARAAEVARSSVSDSRLLGGRRIRAISISATRNTTS